MKEIYYRKQITLPWGMTLKQTTAKGFLWSSIDRIVTQGITFAIGIILARLLSPSDYGIIAMIAIFLAISNTFIDSGLSSALIRRPQRSITDETTAFYTNIVIGLITYLILFISAPYIASFYGQPILIPITRILCLTLVFNSFSIIQTTILTSKIDFKTQTKISFLSSCISGVVGLYMAYNGYGTWALVTQAITSSLFKSLFLWIFVKWRPVGKFSTTSFKELFSFGSRMLVSGLIDTGYMNLSLVLIGKFYSIESLGYYNTARKAATLPSENIKNIIQRVIYPSLSKIQDDNERLSINYRKLITLAAFVIFPIMIWLIVAAKPLIVIVLSEKWINSVPYLQILCLSIMWYPIHTINLNLLQVKGRSNLFLRLEIIKKIIGVIILSITINFGIITICWGLVVNSLFALTINTYYTGKIINVGLFKQMNDIIPILIRAIISGFVAIIVSQYINNNILYVVISLLTFLIVYILLSTSYCINLLREYKTMKNT